MMANYATNIIIIYNIHMQDTCRKLCNKHRSKKPDYSIHNPANHISISNPDMNYMNLG